jgi:cytochrome c
MSLEWGSFGGRLGGPARLGRRPLLGEPGEARVQNGCAIGAGAKNKIGPELNGLDGRKSGTAPDFSYSDANKNSGITWNEAQFKDYIKDPKTKIPGTKIKFAGIKNEKEADDLWAFLAQYDKDGKIK